MQSVILMRLINLSPLRLFRRPIVAAAKAMPSFEVIKKDGAARLGRLTHARGVLETPALLLYTRRGSPLYLTPDMQRELGPDGQNILLDATQLYVLPLHCLSQPKFSTWQRSSGPCAHLRH